MPKDKLLVFKLEDGWKPLCEFLDVPVPDEPFPHLNKKGSIFDELFNNAEMFMQIKKECQVVLLIIFTLIAVFISLFYFHFFSS